MRRTFFVGLVVLSLFSSATAWAQPKGYTVTSDDTAIAMMPELKGAPAPDWLKPGTRITMYQASASIPGSNTVLVQDPDGSWVMKGTGQKFRQDENPGAGGHGFLTVDIIAVQPDAVVTECKTYLINGVPAGPVTLSGLSGYVTTPGVLSEVYVQPAVLKKYLTFNDNGITSTPTKYKAAGQTYDAVWQQILTNGGSMTHVYDPQTGMMLHSASCSTAAPQQVVINGQLQNSGGNTVLAQSTLAGMRQVKAPWTQGKLPAALKDVHQLMFEGSQQTWLADGSPLPPSPLQMKMRVIGRGDSFIQFERTGVMMIGNNRNDMGKSNIVTGPSQLLPFAIEPDDLAQLKTGQELDRDPATQAVTMVSFIGRGGAGKPVVTISEIFPGKNNMRTDAVYDRATGMCVGSSVTNTVLHQLTRVGLKGVQ